MNAPYAKWAADVAAADNARIERDGYCILEGAAPQETIAALAADLAPRFERIGRCDGPFFGRSTKRFQGLLTRSGAMAELVLKRRVLDLVESLLLPHCDRIQLNLTQAIEILPGEKAQVPHRDQDMWRCPVPGVEYVVNVMWPLTPFTAQNGGTRLWRGTHREQEVRRPALEDGIAAELDPGDALVWLGSLIHGGGANVSEAARRGVVVSYSLGWLKQAENMSLTYPPAVARTLPGPVAELIGYRCHAGNLGNYDGRCPSELLTGNFDDSLGASEVMPAHHRPVLERFAVSQAWP